MARQTVQDILRAQRETRDRQYSLLQDSYQRSRASGNEYAGQNYAVDTLATFLGGALADKFKTPGDSPEMAAARVNDAEIKTKVAQDLELQRIQFIADNSVNKVTGEDTSAWAASMWESIYPNTDGAVAAEQPVSANGNELATGRGTFNPQGAQAQDPTASQKVEGLDVFTSKVDTPPAEPTREERDAWLRKTQPGDYARAFSGVTGTAIEKDKQLWQLYRDSLNGNKKISTGNSKSTASGTSYTVRGN